jgi:hypothetical protein
LELHSELENNKKMKNCHYSGRQKNRPIQNGYKCHLRFIKVSQFAKWLVDMRQRQSQTAGADKKRGGNIHGVIKRTSGDLLLYIYMPISNGNENLKKYLHRPFQRYSTETFLGIL